jgi:glycosyltransferase involved in cell wall biosynthesis
MPVLRGFAAPETLAWSNRTVNRRLDLLSPDVIICMTLRAFDPSFADRREPVILDFVDPLSLSYRQRAAIRKGGNVATLIRSAGYLFLSYMMERAERSAISIGLDAYATSGHEDAKRMGCSWLPNLVSCVDEVTADRRSAWDSAEWDVLFVGSLDYLPNVDGVTRLIRDVWPAVLASRPGATLCIAGRHPGYEIQRLTKENGVTLLSNFDSFEAIVTRARIAVAPLRWGTGLQYKVLDAAVYGLAQVITSRVASGMAPGFPASVVDFPGGIAAAINRLLDAPEIAIKEGARSREYVLRFYTLPAWIDSVSRLVEGVTATYPREP